MRQFTEEQVMMNLDLGVVNTLTRTYQMTGKKWDDVLDLYLGIKDEYEKGKLSIADKECLARAYFSLQYIVYNHSKKIDEEFTFLREMTDEEVIFEQKMLSEIPF